MYPKIQCTPWKQLSKDTTRNKTDCFDLTPRAITRSKGDRLKLIILKVMRKFIFFTFFRLFAGIIYRTIVGLSVTRSIWVYLLNNTTSVCYTLNWILQIIFSRKTQSYQEMVYCLVFLAWTSFSNWFLFVPNSVCHWMRSSKTELCLWEISSRMPLQGGINQT